MRHSTKIWRHQRSATRSNSVVEGEFMIQLQEKTDACHRDLPGLLIVYHGLCWLFACESRYIKESTCMEHFPFSTSLWGYFSFFRWLGTIVDQSILASWNNQNFFKKQWASLKFYLFTNGICWERLPVHSFSYFPPVFSNKIHICNVSHEQICW